MPTRSIRFFHRGAITEVTDVAPTRSVLDWLREDAHCTGTKEGCNEGDCGACTVVVASLAAPDDRSAVRGLELRTVNACIQFLPALDGKALFTVEDLKEIAADERRKADDRTDGDARSLGARAGLQAESLLEPHLLRGADQHAAEAARTTSPHQSHATALHPIRFTELHPVQQALVECHGSQCGFCTPGFVMSLWSAYERHRACGSEPSRQQLADELSGNLCRCTGYRPILDAGQRMFDLPSVELETRPVVEALEALASDPPLAYVHGASAFHSPRTLDELARLCEDHPSARILAGSTDIGLWVTKQFRPLETLIYVGNVAGLDVVEEKDGSLVIGAAAPLESAWRALADRFEGLTDVWLRFASPPIRNAGTMGGNVANGSPIGDAAPVLMALDAELVLRKGARRRRIALADFYLDYMKNRLEAGELVEAIAVPLAARSRRLRAYKISKRYDCDISAVLGAFSLELEGDVVKTVRLAFGGMAATVKRAAAGEAALAGLAWNEAAVKVAQKALADDFRPLSDMRATAAYRLRVAQNLLRRFWLETRSADALAEGAVNVWAVMPHDTAMVSRSPEGTTA